MFWFLILNIWIAKGPFLPDTHVGPFRTVEQCEQVRQQVMARTSGRSSDRGIVVTDCWESPNLPMVLSR